MKYEIDAAKISYRQDGYVDFWRREPDSILHQTDEEIPHVDVYRFPPIANTDDDDYYVYLSGGMSDLIQPGTEQADEIFQRVEISIFTRKLVMTTSGKSDFLGWICGWMAHYPFNQKTYFSPGQTFDWGSPLTENSLMHGFYFAHLPYHDEDALCAASGTTKSIIHLIPLSKPELDFTKANGKEKLLSVLEQYGVSPFFDLERKSCI